MIPVISGGEQPANSYRTTCMVSNNNHFLCVEVSRQILVLNAPQNKRKTSARRALPRVSERLVRVAEAGRQEEATDPHAPCRSAVCARWRLRRVEGHQRPGH